jgi:hypothetical protein
VYGETLSFEDAVWKTTERKRWAPVENNASKEKQRVLTKRIIPCLDVKEGRVVKGINFLGLRDAGDPVQLAAAYDRQGADELVFLDITASHEKRDLIFDLAARVAEEVFIPFTVGGGHPLRGRFPAHPRHRRR